jgi:hypothetical protein
VTDADWLASTFSLGAATELRAVARGAVGRVYRLVAQTGVFAAKEYFWWERDETEVAEVADFVDRCREAGVRAPAFVRDGAGRTAVVHPDSGRMWTLHHWADGEAPAPTDVSTTRWLIRQAAAMHRLAAPSTDYPYGHWYCRVEHEWSALADRARRAGAEWGSDLVSRVAAFDELTAFVNAVPIGQTVMCHRDLKPENTLRGSGGWSLIDWDNAGPHEPWREIGTTLLHHVGADSDLADAAALVREYADAGGAPLPADETVFATGVAIWLNFLGAQAALALDRTQDAEHRDFAEARVPGLIAGMPSMAALADAARALRRGAG